MGNGPKFLQIVAALAVTTSVVFGLDACTTVKRIALLEPSPKDLENRCANVDWFEVGRSDGRLGYPLSKLEDQKRRCNNTPYPVDTEFFINGRNVGLLEYCSPTGGLEAGRIGAKYEVVCPSHLEPEFLAAYRKGSRIRDLEGENLDLDNRISNLSGLLLPNLRGGAMNSQVEQLKNRRAQNQDQIDTLEEQTY